MQDIPFRYKSIQKSSEGLYKDRGSKFYAYLEPVKNIKNIEEALSTISSIHPKARHICYAYRLGINGEPHRINDDGEPSGTAGRPIFNVLLSAEISDTLAVVVRYFGGTKLGVPGLIKAYKEATLDAMHGAGITTISLSEKVKITYRIEDMGKVYDILKGRGINNIDGHFDPYPHIIVDIPLNELPTIRQTILADYYGYQAGDIGVDFESDRIAVTIEREDGLPEQKE